MKFILIYLNSPHPHRKSSILDKSHLCQSCHNIVARHFSWVLSLTWVDSTVIKWLFHNIRVVNLNKAVIIISAHIREKCIARENVTHIHTRFTLRTCRKKRILLAGCRRTWACVFFCFFFFITSERQAMFGFKWPRQSISSAQFGKSLCKS